MPFEPNILFSAARSPVLDGGREEVGLRRTGSKLQASGWGFEKFVFNTTGDELR